MPILRASANSIRVKLSTRSAGFHQRFGLWKLGDVVTGFYKKILVMDVYNSVALFYLFGSFWLEGAFSCTPFFVRFFSGKMEDGISSLREAEDEFLGADASKRQKIKPHRQRKKYFNPCEVRFLDSVNNLVEPKVCANSTQFYSEYRGREEKPYGHDRFEPRFGGHQTLEEREKSFYARNQTIHCGFVEGPEGYPSTGFDFDENDKSYMSTCKVVVSSCILRKKLVTEVLVLILLSCV
ncbi:hypothetical protein RHGRI_033668 [Rhododendron griersonianum]|uniref:TOD1/MUCI70 glycosyltransferase-like domain-containing protein n=1 Tax=Rhododendron griersonianum TaxID=479676 RepID=A0AAV6HXP9_9ERIC|nr:hypothetical protein RHGRI_033668 [Rhododendron griersonianum]